MAQEKNTPIPSMYDIFITTFTTTFTIKICQKVGKYTSPMDASWDRGHVVQDSERRLFATKKNPTRETPHPEANEVTSGWVEKNGEGVCFMAPLKI